MRVKDMEEKPRNIDAWLDKVPAYHKGELSPAEAHKMTQMLENDESFRLDAELDKFVIESIASMKADPLPKGLVSKSVRKAVGNTGKANWFSLDTFLVALGVGVGCAATAQFLSGKINLAEIFGKWVTSLVGIAVEGSLGGLLGGVVIASLALLVGGGLWILKMFRSN